MDSAELIKYVKGFFICFLLVLYKLSFLGVLIVVNLKDFKTFG